LTFRAKTPDRLPIVNDLALKQIIQEAIRYRSKKKQQLRGLNQNHNHAMKEIFKGAATRTSLWQGTVLRFLHSSASNRQSRRRRLITQAATLCTIDKPAEGEQDWLHSFAAFRQPSLSSRDLRMQIRLRRL
jgi:hypothetical protein